MLLMSGERMEQEMVIWQMWNIKIQIIHVRKYYTVEASKRGILIKSNQVLLIAEKF